MIRTWFELETAAAEARVRLFCFPHAGGGAALYRPWRAALAPDIAVCPVMLPGRESRWREPPCTRMSQVIEPLFDALLAVADEPFAFFGHSMGAAMAYEITRRFAVSSAGLPSCLVVSGRQPPFLPSRLPPLHVLPSEEFVARLSVLGGTPAPLLQDRQLLSMFLPAMRADFELNETYRPAPGPPIPVPVAAFWGEHDPLVRAQDMAAWQHLTSGAFHARAFAGDHFYLRSAPPQVASALRSAVLEAARRRS